MAQKNWEDVFQKKEIPDEMEEVKTKEGILLSEVLVKNKILSSKSEFRRLIEEGAVTNLDTKEKIIDSNFITKDGQRLKVGKKRFLKIIFS